MEVARLTKVEKLKKEVERKEQVILKKTEKTEMVESGKKRMQELELENAGLARQRRKVEEDAAQLTCGFNYC